MSPVEGGAAPGGALDRYLTQVHSSLEEMVTAQRAAIAAVAEVGADAVRAQRPIHVYDTGHLISHELMERSGGLAAYSPLVIEARLAPPNGWVGRRRPDPEQRAAAPSRLVAWALGQGSVLAGDVLVVSSVSGTSATVVELGLQAKALGVVVVALTSVAFSSRLEPGHSGGHRLFEVADHVLDHGAPYGDAMVEVEGLAQAVAPWSGIGGAVLMWAVTVAIAERLVETGVTPTVFSSYNLPGGGEPFAQALERYRREGR
jgi:uncharacterized phosphosugar-binding protein